MTQRKTIVFETIVFVKKIDKYVNDRNQRVVVNDR